MSSSLLSIVYRKKPAKRFKEGVRQKRVIQYSKSIPASPLQGPVQRNDNIAKGKFCRWGRSEEANPRYQDTKC
jgi:hypothetical protein